MLRQADPRIVPVTADADEPRAAQAKGQMLPAEINQFRPRDAKEDQAQRRPYNVAPTDRLPRLINCGIHMSGRLITRSKRLNYSPTAALHSCRLTVTMLALLDSIRLSKPEARLAP